MNDKSLAPSLLSSLLSLLTWDFKDRKNKKEEDRHCHKKQ
jgi:hypothetical protein